MENVQQSDSQEQDQQIFSALSSNDLKIIPFIAQDGEWILPDSFLAMIWNQTVEEGLAKTVFMERDMGLEQFIFMVKNPRNLFGFVFKEQECCGFAWLNRIDDNSAHAHFGLFQKTWGNTSDVIGKMFLDYWMTLGTDSELLDVIFGVIPLHNKLAQAFVQRIGFAYLGTIPGIIRVPGDKVSATIYYYLRR